MNEIPDEQRFLYLTFHSKPSSSDTLHSHLVTKLEKTWTVHFQRRWLEQFPWLSYSTGISGGTCRFCILFPAQPQRGGSLVARPGVLVLTPFQKPYSKALGKDGILVCHELTTMHHNSTEQANLYKHNFITPEARVDTRLMKQHDQQAVENKEVFLQIVLAVVFLAKQGLPFRGHRDDKVNFDKDDTNRGNFISTMQLLAKREYSSQAPSHCKSKC